MAIRGAQALLVLVAAAMVGLAGCASAVTPESDQGSGQGSGQGADPGSAAGSASGADARPSYLCGGTRISADALAARTPADALTGAAAEALANAVFDDGTPLVLDDPSPWFVVEASDREVTLLRPVDPDDAASDVPATDHEQVTVSWVEATNVVAGWRVTSLGPCALTIDLGDLGVPLIALDPARPLDPASRDVHLLVTEQACNSGRDATGRIEIVRLDERGDRIEVVLGVRPEGGAHTCPSNPPTPFTVTLTEPLGARVVVDATLVTRPGLGGGGTGE